jgi:hypothetical protein
MHHFRDAVTFGQDSQPTNRVPDPSFTFRPGWQTGNCCEQGGRLRPSELSCPWPPCHHACAIAMTATQSTGPAMNWPIFVADTSRLACAPKHTAACHFLQVECDKRAYVISPCSLSPIRLRAKLAMQFILPTCLTLIFSKFGHGTRASVSADT